VWPSVVCGDCEIDIVTHGLNPSFSDLTSTAPLRPAIYDFVPPAFILPKEQAEFEEEHGKQVRTRRNCEVAGYGC
jgi:hypothetical protein